MLRLLSRRTIGLACALLALTSNSAKASQPEEGLRRVAIIVPGQSFSGPHGYADRDAMNLMHEYRQVIENEIGIDLTAIVQWPTFGGTLSTISEVRNRILEFVDRAPGRVEVLIIGHSRGGVLACHLANQLATRNNHVEVTLVSIDPTASMYWGDQYPTKCEVRKGYRFDDLLPFATEPAWSAVGTYGLNLTIDGRDIEGLDAIDVSKESRTDHSIQSSASDHAASGRSHSKIVFVVRDQYLPQLLRELAAQSGIPRIASDWPNKHEVWRIDASPVDEFISVALNVTGVADSIGGAQEMRRSFKTSIALLLRGDVNGAATELSSGIKRASPRFQKSQEKSLSFLSDSSNLLDSEVQRSVSSATIAQTLESQRKIGESLQGQLETAGKTHQGTSVGIREVSKGNLREGVTKIGGALAVSTQGASRTVNLAPTLAVGGMKATAAGLSVAHSNLPNDINHGVSLAVGSGLKGAIEKGLVGDLHNKGSKSIKRVTGR